MKTSELKIAVRENNAELELRRGDSDRFWEALGPDGLHELFVQGNTNGPAVAGQFVAKLRNAIADQDAQAVGNKVIQLVWGVYKKDAEATMIWEAEG